MATKESGRKGAKIGLYFRRKTKTHNLESVTEFHGSRINPLGVSKRLLNVCSGCSGAAQAVGSSPLAEVKVAAAHVRKLKQNQRKKKLILSLKELIGFEGLLFATH